MTSQKQTEANEALLGSFGFQKDEEITINEGSQGYSDRLDKVRLVIHEYGISGSVREGQVWYEFPVIKTSLAEMLRGLFILQGKLEYQREVSRVSVMGGNFK